jgi:hypothetical protein
MHVSQTPVLWLLWAQHNEHRIRIGRVTGYADLRWLGGRTSFVFGGFAAAVSLAGIVNYGAQLEAGEK